MSGRVSQAHSHSEPARESGLPALPAGVMPKASEHFQGPQTCLKPTKIFTAYEIGMLYNCDEHLST